MAKVESIKQLENFPDGTVILPDEKTTLMGIIPGTTLTKTPEGKYNKYYGCIWLGMRKNFTKDLWTNNDDLLGAEILYVPKQPVAKGSVVDVETLKTLPPGTLYRSTNSLGEKLPSICLLIKGEKYKYGSYVGSPDLRTYPNTWSFEILYLAETKGN